MSLISIAKFGNLPHPRSCLMLCMQLEVMSATSVLITPCGGVGTVLTFLQPGATAIVMNYWQNVANTSIQMEAIYYWNLEYLDLKVGLGPRLSERICRRRWAQRKEHQGLQMKLQG